MIKFQTIPDKFVRKTANSLYKIDWFRNFKKILVIFLNILFKWKKKFAPCGIPFLSTRPRAPSVMESEASIVVRLYLTFPYIYFFISAYFNQNQMKNLARPEFWLFWLFLFLAYMNMTWFFNNVLQQMAPLLTHVSSLKSFLNKLWNKLQLKLVNKVCNCNFNTFQSNLMFSELKITGCEQEDVIHQIWNPSNPDFKNRNSFLSANTLGHYTLCYFRQW